MAHNATDGHGTYMYVALDPTSPSSIASSKTRIPGLEDIQIFDSSRPTYDGTRQEDGTDNTITAKVMKRPVYKYKSTFDPNDATQGIVGTGIMALYKANTVTQFWFDAPNVDFPVIMSGAIESCQIMGPNNGLMTMDFGVAWRGQAIVDGVIVP